MCLLIETINISRGKIMNLACHNARFNKAQSELFGIKKDIDLGQNINLKDMVMLRNNVDFIIFE